MVTVEKTPISDCWLITSQEFTDERGSFREWVPNSALQEMFGANFETAQANYSVSKKGTIRGIHYSLAPVGQAKLVTCLSGAIYDVVVDLREDSATFKKWIGIELSAGNAKSVYIGPGLGHAFLALEEAGVSYLLSSPFNPASEYGINPFDSDLEITWPEGSYLLSDKDKNSPTLQFAKLRA
jgi:dTDP-4-dehydrorhamnose 3,5-epimerase